MNKSLHFAIYFLLILGVSSDVLSRGSSSSSRSSSSRSSSSRSSSSSFSRPKSAAPKPTVAPKPVSTPAQATRNVSQSSTIKKQTATTSVTAKPKAVSSSIVDKKKAKAMASQNKAAASKYGTKANAEKAYREKIAASNHYNSPTPPSTRPASVPQSITINNTNVSTSYGRLPGGYYGYGYYDPITHAMVAIAAHQMMIDDAMMMESGYGHWGNNGRPVVVHNASGSGSIIFFNLIGIIGVVVLIYVIASRQGK